MIYRIVYLSLFKVYTHRINSCVYKLNRVISLIFKKVTKTVSLLIILKKRLFPWLMQSNKPFLRLQRQISNPSRPVPGPQVQYIWGIELKKVTSFCQVQYHEILGPLFTIKSGSFSVFCLCFFQLYFLLYIFSLTRMVFLLKYILHPELSGNWIVFR